MTFLAEIQLLLIVEFDRVSNVVTILAILQPIDLFVLEKNIARPLGLHYKHYVSPSVCPSICPSVSS